MKPTHKTVYTMDIKSRMCCWLIGNCRDKPLTQRRKLQYSKGKTQYKKQSILNSV